MVSDRAARAGARMAGQDREMVKLLAILRLKKQPMRPGIEWHTHRVTDGNPWPSVLTAPILKSAISFHDLDWFARRRAGYAIFLDAQRSTHRGVQRFRAHFE